MMRLAGFFVAFALGAQAAWATDSTSIRHSAGEACRHERISNERLEVCVLTNQSRLREDLIPLQLDPVLSRVAQSHAQDMLARDYFSHESPNGGTLRTRLVGAGIRYGFAGENIAKGQSSAGEVVQDWMKSPGHRRNILQPEFRKIGVGKAGSLWVQVFSD
jgi:uncharacterized protein YkwD